MFRTDLLSVIGNLNTVFTAICICHTGYFDCLLVRSGWNSFRHPDLQSSFIMTLLRSGHQTCMKRTNAECTVDNC
jgi:hypothetical protein